MLEESAQNGGGFRRQRGFLERVVHEFHPAVAGGLIDGERRVPHAEARMAAFFDIAGRTAEASDEEVAKAFFGAREVVFRVHRSEKIVARDLTVKGGDETGKSVLPDCVVHFIFLHLLSPW